MKRLINLRLSLVCAICFVLGIFAFYELLFADFWVGVAIAVVLTVSIIVFACKRNKYLYVCLLALVFLLLGFGRSYLCYDNINGNEVCERSVVLYGRVTDLGRNGNENGVVYLDGCTDGEGAKYDGVVRVRCPADESLDTGDYVSFNGVLSSVYPVKNSVDSYCIRNNVRYELRDAALIERASGALKTDEKIRRYIYEVTQNYMPDNGGVMYALLTGDRSALSEGVEFSFARAGILHLLAVSGLHVGFVAAAVCFALRRFKLHPAVECAIVLVPLVFYAYVCNFSPSVLRAIIMLACSYVARMLYSRYDMLTSIAWAAVATLCICPFYLFDAGFQLSFLSVYGIATVYAAVHRRLVRTKLNKCLIGLVDTVCVSLACVASTSFVMATNGMEIALFGFAVNIVAVPLVSVAFALGVFGMIPWVFHYLTVAADAVLQFVVRCSQAVAQLSFAAVSISALSVSVVVACIIMYAVGGFVDLNKLGKRIFYPISAFLLVLCFVFAVVPTQRGGKSFVCQTDSDSIVVAVSSSGEAAMVGDFADYYATLDAVRFLSEQRYDGVTLYIARYSDALPASIRLVFDELRVDKVYLMGTDSNLGVDEYFSDNGTIPVRQYPNAQTGDKVKVRSLCDAGLIGAVVDCDGIRICVAYGERGARQIYELGFGADLYLLPAAETCYSDAGATTLTAYQSDLPHNYGANKYGNFTIRQKSGNIILSFR